MNSLKAIADIRFSQCQSIWMFYLPLDCPYAAVKDREGLLWLLPFCFEEKTGKNSTCVSMEKNFRALRSPNHTTSTLLTRTDTLDAVKRKFCRAM